MKYLRPLLYFLFLLSLNSCGSFGKKLKSFLGGPDTSEKKTGQLTRFSQNPNMSMQVARKAYKRMNKENFDALALIKATSIMLYLHESS